MGLKKIEQKIIIFKFWKIQFIRFTQGVKKKHFLYHLSREKMNISQFFFKWILVIFKFEPEIPETEIEFLIELKWMFVQSREKQFRNIIF